MRNGIKTNQQMGSADHGIDRWGMFHRTAWLATSLRRGGSGRFATPRDSGPKINPRKKTDLARQLSAWGMIVIVHISFSGVEAAYAQSYDSNGTASGAGGSYGLSPSYGLSAGSYVSDPITSYTAAWFNGTANLVRAEGQYHLDASKASLHYEQARTIYLDNQQRMLEVRRAEYWASVAARDKVIEERHHAQMQSKEFLAAHRPLPSPGSDLDPITGRIHWPSMLMAMDFDTVRKELDSLFEKRAQTGSPIEEISHHIKVNMREMKKLLHEHVLKMPLEEYSEARQFLDQLAAAAQLKPRQIDVRSAKKMSKAS